MDSAIERLERSSEVSATRRNRSDRSPTKPATQASAPSERTVSTCIGSLNNGLVRTCPSCTGASPLIKQSLRAQNYTTVQSPRPVEHEATTGLFRVRSEPGPISNGKAHSRATAASAASASAMHARRRAAACAKRSRCRGQASGNGGARRGAGDPAEGRALSRRTRYDGAGRAEHGRAERRVGSPAL